MPSHYFFYCGNSIENVTTLCDSVKIVERARSKEIHFPIRNLGKTSFLGVVAVDKAGNNGDLSNVVEVYLKDPNEPTTTGELGKF